MFICLLFFPFLLTLCAATETTASLRSVTDALSHDRSAGFHKSSTSSGIITTVAGDKVEGGGSEMDGVAATSRKISGPKGLAFDKVGNFYIADSDDHKIYKVTASSGIITTVAGTDKFGYGGDGGQATSATLYQPYGVALDTNGNIFIADSQNHRIRKITISTGLITKVAGDGNNAFTKDNIAATSSSLNNPRDVAVDPSGNMFIADTNNDRIRKVTASTGIITTIAGSDFTAIGTSSAVATKYYLFFPFGVTLDTAGNVYIAGSLDSSIFKVTVSTGNISIVAGTGPYPTGKSGYNGDDILATTAQLNQPTKVVFDASGNMYISDSYNYRIRKVTASTGIISTVAGTGSFSVDRDNGEGGLATSASILPAGGMAIDTAGNLFYADAYVVRKVTFTGATPSISITSAPSLKSAPTSPSSTPVAPTPTASAPTPGASSPSSSSTSSSPSLSPTVRPSTFISMAPTPGASSPSSSPSLSPTARQSTTISMAPTPGASPPSSSKAPTAPSSTAVQSSSTTHFAQTIHLTIILLSSLLILHLCRDA